MALRLKLKRYFSAMLLAEETTLIIAEMEDGAYRVCDKDHLNLSEPNDREYRDLYRAIHDALGELDINIPHPDDLMKLMEAG